MFSKHLYPSPPSKNDVLKRLVLSQSMGLHRPGVGARHVPSPVIGPAKLRQIFQRAGLFRHTKKKINN